MRVLWENNPTVMTKITGPDLEEIKKYCKKNSLEIDYSESYRSSRGYVVYAIKPNNTFTILRKEVQEIEGYRLIEDRPTKKMHWLTYQKVPVQK